MSYYPSINSTTPQGCSYQIIEWSLDEVGDSILIEQQDLNTSVWHTRATLSTAITSYSATTYYLNGNLIDFCAGVYTEWRVTNVVGGDYEYFRETTKTCLDTNAPSDLTLVSKTDTTITVSWNNNPSTCDSAINNLGVHAVHSPQNIDFNYWNGKIPSLTANTITLTGCTQNTNYSINVYKNACNGNNKDSNYINVTTEITSIIAPSGLSASNITSTGFTLTWVNNNTSNVTGNTIQKYSGGNWVDIKSVSSGTTSTAITGCTPAEEVDYRVVAKNNLSTAASQALTVQTYGLVDAIESHVNINCYGADNGSITISDEAGGSGFYQYTINGGTNWSNSPSFTNLSPSTYNVKIRDGNDYSNVYTINSSLTLTQPQILSCTITTEDVTYFMGDDGTIGFSSIAGGNPNNYDTSIDGGLTWQSTSGNNYITYYGLTAGTYNCLLRNSLVTTCVIDKGNVVINQPIPNPYDLTVSNITYTGATLEWIFDDVTGIIFIQQLINGVWTSIESVDVPTAFFDLSSLLPQTTYTFRVALDVEGTLYPSNEVQFSTLPFPISFCIADNQYSVINSTCGNSNGSIVINDSDYLMFFNFNTVDINGNQHALTGLTSGYYTLVATPKTIYQYWYGGAPCYINWIPIEDSNTSISINDVVIKNTIQSFLIAAGTSTARIYISYSDTCSGCTHNYYYYGQDKTNLLTVTGSTNPNAWVLNDVANGFYYGVIENDNGCKALVGPIQVKNENQPFNVSGVKRVFVSEYKADLDWNQWSTADEDYYVQSLDILKFQSAKIKEFTNANQWYSLPTDIDTNFVQKMNRTRQGFVFTNTLSLSFSPSSYNKWLATKELLDHRFVVIFEDCNGGWWVFGYQNEGSKVNVYSRKSDFNYYSLEFESNSGDKILTAISYNDYVYPIVINS